VRYNIYYAINVLLIVEDDGEDCRNRLQYFTQVLYVFVSNVTAARKKRNRIMYSHIDLLPNVEGDAVECRKRLDCFTQVL
jgi:hypothetical protein